jgi:APA family basic amino acid/polyamine antiporter
MNPLPVQDPPQQREFVRGLGFWDSTMLVAGSMVGSGIFIVSADISRHLGGSGWLLAAWLFTGALTITAALSYGELAAMMPHAGGQYVYLREAFSPLWGFLYGWTSFLVIQTGTIAAVAVAFSRFLGVLVPAVSPTLWIVPPANLSTNYAISLSTQQLVAILMVAALTWVNLRGLHLAKLIQNVFTSAKGLSLIAVITVGLLFGLNTEAAKSNFGNFWEIEGTVDVKPELEFLPTLNAKSGLIGLVVAFCVAQVGSLFSSDAWNNITFAAGEVKDPRRNIPMSLAVGTGLVTLLYVLVNVAYLCVLPLSGIQHAPDDRVATAAMEAVFPGAGPVIMAVAIMISTFGCNNGLILAGARVYYAMARDGLFFRLTGSLNKHGVPAVALLLQCLWTCCLILPRTRLRDPASSAPLIDPASGMQRYGNLYSNLLDYVVFAVLVFYVLTIVGLFVLRRRVPKADRPYRAWGYPWVPALYIGAATFILLVLLLYRTQTTWPGLAIVVLGIPAFVVWRKREPGPIGH